MGVRFDVLTIFPEIFRSPLECSILKKAREKGLVTVCVHDVREFAQDRHRMTDDYPYGGGGGMVMKVEPIDRAIRSLDLEAATPVILLSPQGETFRQETAEELARCGRIVLICGRYEGVDERVRLYIANRELSIGDYVLSGGETAALVIIDAVARLVPGVLGNITSVEEDSFVMGLLEYPHYTRPAVYGDWRVPEVLLSGHHGRIEAWRRREALRRTAERRPDLLKKVTMTEEERRLLGLKGHGD